MKQSCPPQAVWQKIVAEGFVDFSLGDLSTHLDVCPDCQAAVEGLLGGERAWLAIATELRQEPPPTSQVCRRKLADLKEHEAFRSVTPADFLSQSEADHDTPSRRVYCQHCLELVTMEETGDGSPGRCPLCWRAVGATGQEAILADYQMSTREVNSPREVQEYVQFLEKRARQEQKKQPYHRGRFPADLVAGLILILIGCGFLVLATAYVGEGRFMAALVNGILPAVILMLIGALCLVFWAK